jgi:hypothetical protein
MLSSTIPNILLRGTLRTTRRMSSTAKVWIDRETRVICQGFTGKQVRGYDL